MMAFNYNTVDIAANGGGEGSATNNVLLVNKSSNPTSRTLMGRLTGLTITNATGANGEIFIDDVATAASAIAAVAMLRIEVSANETQRWVPEDTNGYFFRKGLVAQASNGATSAGYKVTAFVDEF